MVKHRRWRCVACRYQVSLTAGTVLHNTKMPLTVWFWAAYLMTTDKRGISALLLQRQLGFRRYETAWMMLHKFRRAMVNVAREPLRGEVEVDESYFGGRRKGKRGRGAAGKVPVFGILKRGGKVYTQVIENAKAKMLLPIIKQRVIPDSIVYSDTFKSYNSLNVEGYHHVRVNHSETFAASKRNHINGIENFWNQAKRHLRKFNGIPKETFPLYLEECEWRFNCRTSREMLFSSRKILTLY